MDFIKYANFSLNAGSREAACAWLDSRVLETEAPRCCELSSADGPGHPKWLSLSAPQPPHWGHGSTENMTG